MRREHERKKLADEEKFEALLEQKECAAEEFSGTIRQLKLEQDELLDRMAAQHEEQLLEATQTRSRLLIERTQEEQSIIEKRKDAEENAWLEIDILTDKNKDQLAEHIERGLENKAELTKFMQELNAQNQERNNKAKEL